MAAIRLLVDTDVLIDYFNLGSFARLLDDPRADIYYSIITRKELLSKPGLNTRQREAISAALQRFRLVRLSPSIAACYSRVRQAHPALEKEDALIAATALVKKLPLFTRNWRHFRLVTGLRLYAERG